jgi:hypothetical protein
MEVHAEAIYLKKLIRMHLGHVHGVMRLINNKLLSAGSDGIRSFKLDDGSCDALFQDLSFKVHGVRLDEQRLIAWGDEENACFWDMTKGKDEIIKLFSHKLIAEGIGGRRFKLSFNESGETIWIRGSKLFKFDCHSDELLTIETELKLPFN